MNEGQLNGVESLKNPELVKAAEVGRRVVETAHERQNPRFSKERYTLPMLRLDQMPPGAVRTVRELVVEGKEVDERVIRGASLALAIEAAVQIVQARPISSRIVEHSDSLTEVLRMTNAGVRLHREMEATDPDLILVAARAAIAKRKNAGMANAQGWNDEQALEWSKGTVMRAHQRVGKSLDAINAYHGR
jgi:hypothetical protein